MHRFVLKMLVSIDLVRLISSLPITPMWVKFGEAESQLCVGMQLIELHTS